MESLEIPRDVVVGHSEAIVRTSNTNDPDGDGMVLEDIKNENRIAYGHEHHSEL